MIYRVPVMFVTLRIAHHAGKWHGRFFCCAVYHVRLYEVRLRRLLSQLAGNCLAAPHFYFSSLYFDVPPNIRRCFQCPIPPSLPPAFTGSYAAVYGGKSFRCEKNSFDIIICTFPKGHAHFFQFLTLTLAGLFL